MQPVFSLRKRTWKHWRMLLTIPKAKRPGPCLHTELRRSVNRGSSYSTACTRRSRAWRLILGSSSWSPHKSQASKPSDPCFLDLDINQVYFIIFPWCLCEDLQGRSALGAGLLDVLAAASPGLKAALPPVTLERVLCPTSSSLQEL